MTALDYRFDPARAALPLRDYQQALVGALVTDLSTQGAGRRRHIRVATRGGKNFILNELIGNHALKNGQRVLWVTFEWDLLAQAAADLCQRYPGMQDNVGIFGDPPAKLFNATLDPISLLASLGGGPRIRRLDPSHTGRSPLGALSHGDSRSAVPSQASIATGHPHLFYLRATSTDLAVVAAQAAPRERRFPR